MDVKNRVGVVFIGGDLDGKQATLSLQHADYYRHAVLPTEMSFSVETTLLPRPLDNIETYRGQSWITDRPYILMALEDTTPDEVFNRLLDYYVEHAEAVQLATTT